MDNRPLTHDEFDSIVNQTIYVSATPADFELERAEGVVVEQVIRPTGLLDPPLKSGLVTTSGRSRCGDPENLAEDERVLVRP